MVRYRIRLSVDLTTESSTKKEVDVDDFIRQSLDAVRAELIRRIGNRPVYGIVFDGELVQVVKSVPVSGN